MADGLDGVFASVFEALLEQHGRQGWWPASDRFEIMAGAVLVQRTAWRNAAIAIDRLKAGGYMAPEAIADLAAPRLEALIRPAGFFRVKAKRLKALARFVVASGGVESLDRHATGALRAALLAQPGIGPETADAMLSYAFARPVFVVDSYARRLFERLGQGGEPISDEVLKSGCEAAVRSVADLQELHALIVVHGQRHCGATPSCPGCTLQLRCGYAARHLSRSA